MTLGATTLPHEAYLDLSRRQAIDFPDQARFMAYAARAMRGLAIDCVRKRQALRRGGQFELIPLDTFFAEHHAAPMADPHSVEQLETLSDALDRLARVGSPLAELVDLKFFGGLNFAEIAGLRSVSERTVLRHWAKTGALLHGELVDITNIWTGLEYHAHRSVELEEAESAAGRCAGFGTLGAGWLAGRYRGFGANAGRAIAHFAAP
jgi:RNA polymerase sigma factor (TIGR02999 family)